MGLFSTQLSAKRLAPMCRQLATSYEAGLPLLRAIALISREERNPKVRELLGRIGERIRQGDTLGDSVRAESRYLPPFLVELLASGESGGKLDAMFKDLSNYFEDRVAMQRQIMQMMAYPMLQLLAGWFLGTFALMLVRLFRQAIAAMGGHGGGGNVNLSEFVSYYAAFQGKALLLAGTLFAVCVLLSRAGLFGWIWGAVATYVWPLSGVTRRFALARFFRCFSLLLGAGVDVVRCIERSTAAALNPYVARDLLNAIPWIRNGATLTEAFAGSTLLTKTAREMIAVGEESGKLEMTLRKVADYHMEEATHAVQLTVRILNVVIGLAVGAAIGYVVISFWTSYYGGIMDALKI